MILRDKLYHLIRELFGTKTPVQRLLLGSWLLIITLMPFHAFISTWGGSTLGPLEAWKSWKEILILGCLVFGALYLWRRRQLGVFFRDKLVLLIFAYALLHGVLWLLYRPETEAVLAGILINLRFLGMFLLTLVILTFVQPMQLLRAALMTVGFGGMLVLGVAVAQLTFLPSDFLRHFGYGAQTIAPVTTLDDNDSVVRLQSTLRGPNPLGQYLIIITLLLLPLWQKSRRQIVAFWLGLSAIIMFYTYSRSAWIGVAVGLAVYGFLSIPSATLRKRIMAGALVGAIVCAGIVALILPHSTFMQHTILHNKQGDNDIGSTAEHFKAGQRSLENIASHPLGQGPGTAGPASFYGDVPNIPENYFLQVAEELGLLGLVLFVAINAIVAQRLWRRRQNIWAAAWIAAFAGITVVNIFLHGWADETTALVWWAIAAVLISPKLKLKENKVI